MINVCPFCGFHHRPFNDGISFCDNCSRVFDSSPNNRMYAAAWFCRKNHLLSADTVKEMYGLNDAQTSIVQDLVIDHCYSHDEFIKLVPIGR